MPESEKNLTSEQIKDLERILNIKHGQFLDDRCFILNLALEKQVAHVTVCLQNESESFVYPVEGKIELNSKEISVKDAFSLIIDFIGIYFDEYFENDENTFIPIDWTKFDFEGQTLLLKGQVRNKKAERSADALLEKNSDRETFH